MHFTIPLKEQLHTNSVISHICPRNRAKHRKGTISVKKDYYCLKKTQINQTINLGVKKKYPSSLQFCSILYI